MDVVISSILGGIFVAGGAISSVWMAWHGNKKKEKICISIFFVGVILLFFAVYIYSEIQGHTICGPSL